MGFFAFLGGFLFGRFFFFSFLIMHCSKAIVKTPFGHIRGVSGMDREREIVPERKRRPQRQLVLETRMVYFCVFFHCCTTEALGTWIRNSVEESDPKEAMHSLCFLGFSFFVFLRGK